MIQPQPTSTLFPYTTLFRSNYPKKKGIKDECSRLLEASTMKSRRGLQQDRKSGSAGMPRPISYAVFCLKKKRLSEGRGGWRAGGHRVRRCAEEIGLVQ